MKLLLLGKNGQLGSELDRRAKELGFAIDSFGREELDITDYDRLYEPIEQREPDIVVNAAAYHVVPECERYPDKAFEVNAIALRNLVEICDRKGITLVHYSTDYVFDGLKGKPYAESDIPSPLQVYGISKLAGEFVTLNYSQRSLVIRTCGVYAGKSGSRAKKGNFVLTILKQGREKSEVEVSSEQIVSPTYAVDLAEATLQLLQAREAQGLYHLVNAGYCSWAEFAQKIVEYKCIKTEIVPVDRGGMAGTLRRPLFSALENTRARELGITMPHWQDALKRYLETI